MSHPSDAQATARSMSSAVHDLARATVTNRPEDLYPVLGEVLATTRWLAETVDNLSRAHLTHRSRAADDHGGHASGRAAAVNAADRLRIAAELLSRVEAHLDASAGQSSQIAWRPGNGVRSASRWIEAVHLEGDDAAPTLAALQSGNVAGAVAQALREHRSSTTPTAAMEHGYVYDREPPHRPHDQSVRRDGCWVVFDPYRRQVTLYRETGNTPDVTLSPSPRRRAPSLPAASSRPGKDIRVEGRLL